MAAGGGRTRIVARDPAGSPRQPMAVFLSSMLDRGLLRLQTLTIILGSYIDQ